MLQNIINNLVEASASFERVRSYKQISYLGHLDIIIGLDVSEIVAVEE